ncbi:hypothetical protein ACFY00_11455 [Kitasatospora sp. NPDC001540]|uniref:hypothetical protein n=1 Tax=Kitasatospora sp. NPDC001540 TaxID=3364014 RepID=UPI00367D2B1E
MTSSVGPGRSVSVGVDELVLALLFAELGHQLGQGVAGQRDLLTADRGRDRVLSASLTVCLAISSSSSVSWSAARSVTGSSVTGLTGEPVTRATSADRSLTRPPLTGRAVR